jgi:U3 small nucleolar RNA-associated protein MPP10
LTRPSTKKAEIFTKLARVLYTQIREENSQPDCQFYHRNALNRLSTGHLDVESLWNQIDIENKFFVKQFVRTFCEDQDTDGLVSDQPDFFQRSAQLVSDSEEELDEDLAQGDDEDVDEEEDDDEDEADDEEQQLDEEDDEADDDEDENDLELETKEMTRKYNLDERVANDDDDTLFKSNEMSAAQLQNELKRMEMDDDDDDEDEPEDEQAIDKNLVYDDNEENEDDEDEDGDEEQDEPEDSLDPNKSNFEQANDKMRKNISKIEQEMMSERPWQLKGEVNAVNRPQNSLLEEYVDFESGARAAPLMTEEVSKRLEQIIIERIKDQKYDDVERKVKQVEQAFEYKRRIILDTEKSKSSLAQLYEAEFLKQRDGDSEKSEPVAHIDVRQRMRRLFVQLDALCNFHYTPKAAVSEMKIINNLPAISAEEAIPSAVSDAQLVAPQEIEQPAKRDVKGDSEKSKADKTRERRLKKLKVKRRIEMNKKEGKLAIKPNNKMSKKAQKKADSKMSSKPKQANHEGIENAFLKLHKN